MSDVDRCDPVAVIEHYGNASWRRGLRVYVAHHVLGLVADGRHDEAVSVTDALIALAEDARDFEPATPDLRPLHLRRELWIGRKAYGEYLKSDEWQQRRLEALERFGHRCAVCNRGDLTLNVHHRTYERVQEERPDDLTVVCQPCHHNFHERRPEAAA